MKEWRIKIPSLRNTCAACYLFKECETMALCVAADYMVNMVAEASEDVFWTPKEIIFGEDENNS